MKVIGYGTGRCGTQSLASFLNQQPDLIVTHEKVNLGWFPIFDDDYATIGNFINSEVTGDISYEWLNYAGYVLSKYNVKAINIIRDDEEVIESFYTYKSYLYDYASFMENEWFGHPYHSDKPTKDAIAQMVKYYRYWEKQLKNSYKDRIYIIETCDLNDKTKLNDLLDWIGVTDKNLTACHTNKR